MFTSLCASLLRRYLRLNPIDTSCISVTVYIQWQFASVASLITEVHEESLGLNRIVDFRWETTRAIFSSPGTKCQGEVLGWSCVRRASSCVVNNYINIFSSETTEQNLTKLHQKHPWGRGNKRYRMKFWFHHYSGFHGNRKKKTKKKT